MADDPRHEVLDLGSEDYYALVEISANRSTWSPAFHELLDLELIDVFVKPHWRSGDEKLVRLSPKDGHAAIDDPASWDPFNNGRIVVFGATPEGERAYRDNRFR